MHERMDRQQFDGGHAQPVQMLDDPRIAQSGEAAALLHRNDPGAGW